MRRAAIPRRARLCGRGRGPGRSVSRRGSERVRTQHPRRALLSRGASTRARAARRGDGAVDVGGAVAVVTGLIYCIAIASCSRCSRSTARANGPPRCRPGASHSPSWSPFSGRCLVHRAEIMQLGGGGGRRSRKRGAPPTAAWRETTRRRPRTRSTSRPRFTGCAASSPPAEAPTATPASTGASRSPVCRCCAWRRDAKRRGIAIRCALGATSIRCAGRGSCRRRWRSARRRRRRRGGHGARAGGDRRRFGTEVLGAMAAHARGSVSSPTGDAQAALEPLRRAFHVWQQVGAPYIAARIRLLCTRLPCPRRRGRRRLELDAAREVFERLGAAPSRPLSTRPASGPARAPAPGG